MTLTPTKKTCDQFTSSQDLIQSNHKAVCTEICSSAVATNTTLISVADRETSCEGLVRCRDSISGPDHVTSFKDTSTFTDPVSTRHAAVSCHMVTRKPVTDRSTMTVSSGRWVCFSDQITVACGPDEKISAQSIATNTPIVMCKDQATATFVSLTTDKSVSADIRPTVSHVSVNTTRVLKYNQATDCFDIRPSLRHNASNTVPIKTNNVSTQYILNKSSLIDTATNTDVVNTSDVSTSTSSANTQTIDVYVDKVRKFISIF